MTAFNVYNIQTFNQKVKHLIGDGKTVMTNKELRDLNHDIMDMLLHLNSLEAEIAALKNKVTQAGDITIELDGKSFR
jgi:predicted  nucleic acid-binding Zn-ribbon protein